MAVLIGLGLTSMHGDERGLERAAALDATPTGGRLCIAHGDPAGFKVHVSPAQRTQLADPQTGEHERGEYRVALDVSAILARDLVEFRCCVQQSDDLARA